MNSVTPRTLHSALARRWNSNATATATAAAASLFPSVHSVTPEDLLSRGSGKGKYYIYRNKTGNLPVYSDIRNAGSRVETQINRIHGDPLQLKVDLQQKLDFIPDKDWKVNLISNKIIIKGDYVSLVKKILSSVF